MSYRGHVRNGQILLVEAAQLPEGAEVNVEVVGQRARISRPPLRRKLQQFEPVRIPGDSLADELIRDRR